MNKKHIVTLTDQERDHRRTLTTSGTTPARVLTRARILLEADGCGKRIGWAERMKKLSDEHYLEAERILLVLDNLNTHRKASFYEVYAPEEARRLAERVEIHYTPKHGSWLNMAEIELSVVSRQYLSRHIPTWRCSRARRVHGRPDATMRAPRSIGSSRPRTPASS